MRLASSTPHATFYGLSILLRVDLLADIGAMDSRQSLLFHKLRPRARIVAFEPNPANFAVITADPRIAKAGVEVHPCAVAAFTGTAPFHVFEPGESQAWARGTGSLLDRVDPVRIPQRQIDVSVVTLAGFLRGQLPKRAALWIDVEGAASDVIQGMVPVAKHVALLHVELETQPIWMGQQLEDDILAMLRQLGYLVVDRGSMAQRDVVLLREDLHNRYRRRVRLVIGLTRVLLTLRTRLRRRACGG